jgi:ABC-type transport system substrate-binding protein/DNA-binding winged helix-turn-helix (wHTH) protein
MSEQPNSGAGIGPGNATSGDERGLRFEILGPIRVTLNGCAVNLGGAQQRAVLGLLLIDHDTPVSVARIADAVWGGRPPPGHATTIQTYVFHLREALEPDRPRGARAQVIISERGGYRLDTDSATIDAREFERLAHSGLEHVRNRETERALPELDAALGLWRGEVFADVAELEAVTAVAAHLNELRLTVVEQRIDALLAFGRHVGGTLTVGTSNLPGGPYGIDPANLYYWWTTAAERFVYDGLVAFRAANGAAGFTLVPDLAARMPTRSQDGKTYTFTLRTGIRYSTGQIVHAQDFALGFRRVFTVARTGNPNLFDGVVGAPDCIARPTTYDLSGGITADDAHHLLSIHLTAPDADFLHKLAYLVFPAPPGTSAKQVTTSPVPGTGPYQIQAGHQRFNKADHTMETTFDTLIRNPYFHQWSFAAQPAGYPDVIKFREYSRAEDAVKAVRAGTVDVGGVAGGDTAKLGALVAGLQLRDPDRLHSLTRPGKWWVALNTQVPPFDNKLARQAVNYAVDREQLIKDQFGPGQIEPTCQMLPPNFPGHEWYCPYTRAGPKPYDGPDLNKAKNLVAQSGTRGVHVTVYGKVGDLYPHALADLAKALRDIGYKASTRLAPDTTDSAYFYDPRHGVQIFAPDGWIADYPAPDTYYESLLSCSVKNQTTSGFCNEHIDDLAAAARRTALTDPGAARRMWTDIDHAVTDEAPWVTLGGEVTYQFTSNRVGNYQSTPFNPLYDQLWVK